MRLIDSPVFASELISCFRDGYSPVDELARILARITAYDGQLNCIATLNQEAACLSAKASEMRWQEGRPLSPLDGVPVTVKDMLPVEGLPSRCGSLITSPDPAVRSAPIVQALVDAGAVIIGLTTTAEFGGASVTISPLTGITRNAHDASRTAGGSSGGAAVSVAAGFCAIALATDTGGSIRVPAALNGVVGYKPTGGRFQSGGGQILQTMTCPGPIANSVEDCALLLYVLGMKPLCARSTQKADGAGVFKLAGRDSLEGLHIVASRTLGYATWLALDVSNAFDKQLDALRTLGATVTELEPDWHDPVDIFAAHTRANYAEQLRDLSDDEVALLSPQVRDARRAGIQAGQVPLARAMQDREGFSKQVAGLLNKCDLLFTPMTATAAFDACLYMPDCPETQANPRAWTPFGYPFNLSRNPGVALRGALSPEGLPIGFQLLAKVGQDEFLLEVAHSIEVHLRKRSAAYA
ncbi:amidase [Pusillimonas sp.]|uniref:amidase n=1 Tax=Pusillimonas sp. TaxID=3040095 RepID=UPI0037C91065